MSSAFFWPYPHPNRRDFIRTGPIQTDSGQQYSVTASSEVYPTDAFTRLKITPTQLQVEFFTRKGELLGSETYPLG